MNIKCPNCGAVNSLDSLIGNDGAAELVKAVLEFEALHGADCRRQEAVTMEI